MYLTIVDCEHFTDTIGKFDTQEEAESAGKAWLEFQQLDFLIDGFTEAERMEINDRCANGEDINDILYDELGFDCTYGVVEEIADEYAGLHDHLKDEQSPGYFDRYIAGDR
jgi:hypothetical protein